MLLDTTIIVDILRHRAAGLTFYEGLECKPSLSVITCTELFAGARNRKEETDIESVLRTCRMCPVDEPIARRAGQWLRHYRASHGLNDPDALIAATAEHHDLALATLNVKHFPMFAKLKKAY